MLERSVNMDAEGWLGQWGLTPNQVRFIKKDFTENVNLMLQREEYIFQRINFP